MRFDNATNLATFLTTSHLFSEHIGLNGKKFRKVGPVQYAIHWLYGISEPLILRVVDYLLSKKVMTETPFGKWVLKGIAATSYYFPHGIIATTPAVERLVDFIIEKEGPKGAIIAVGPCVCQRALNQWKEPCKKDMTVLYGADIYHHLNIGYDLISGEQAKERLRECHDAGLVHAIEFCMQSGKWVFVVCNCDTEICVPTRVFFHTGKFLYKGPEIVSNDPLKCMGIEKCGKCLTRCVFGAYQVVDGSIRVKKEKCMGCGLCVSTCAGKARTMIKRQHYPHEHQVPSEILLGKV